MIKQFINLQYNTLVRWADWDKRLIKQATDYEKNPSSGWQNPLEVRSSENTFPALYSSTLSCIPNKRSSM